VQERGVDSLIELVELIFLLKNGFVSVLVFRLGDAFVVLKEWPLSDTFVAA
jgi:hypothetical protein